MKEAQGMDEKLKQQWEKLRMRKRLLRPVDVCTPGNGVFVFDAAQKADLVTYFNLHAPTVDVCRFVPASGAATRMFAHLLDPDKSPADYIGFIEHLPEFPFFSYLEKAGLGGKSPAQLIAYLLGTEGLNYAALPKALIAFHAYPEMILTALDEQVFETMDYGIGKSGGQLHFTVPPAFKEEISARVCQTLAALGQAIAVEYSVQNEDTNTVALDASGKLLRDKQGQLVRRPGGHGSLLHNLNQVDADLCFIKNVDNVYRRGDATFQRQYKALLGGLTLTLVSLRNELITRLEAEDVSALAEARQFVELWFINKEKGCESPKTLTEMCRFLDRPLRVCGVVRNTGEPGGGPFWMSDETGFVRGQIVEMAELDLTDPYTQSLIAQSSHFNPVDLVCALRNHRGEKFDLAKFADASRYFTAEKTHEGQSIKVMEHPGLWNGGMADWNTVFVEVPLETFNPVKTVNDLLRPAHKGH